jgi:hypothetical protein
LKIRHTECDILNIKKALNRLRIKGMYPVRHVLEKRPTGTFYSREKIPMKKRKRKGKTRRQMEEQERRSRANLS